MNWLKKSKKIKKEAEWVEYEITPDSIFGAKEEPSESKEIDIDKMKLWFPEVNEKYINRWKVLNDFFIQYYPGEKERLIKNSESVFSSINLWNKVNSINEKIMKGNYDATILKEKEDLKNQAYKIDETAPRGYKGFLKYNESISPTMDNLIKEHPDIFERYLYSYWTEGYYLYDRYIKLVEFAFTLMDYQLPPKSSILNCDKKSVSQIKIDKKIIPIPDYWGWLVIDGIVNEIKGFIEEICKNDRIYIDIERQSLEDIKEILLQKANEFNFKEVKGKELDKQRYVAKRFAEIIQWRNKDIWTHRYNASIFIARFLNFLGFEIKYLKELEEDFKKAPKDENGRPVKSHPYHIVKHSLDKTIGDLIEK